MRLEKLRDHAEIEYIKSGTTKKVCMRVKIHGQHEFAEKFLDEDSYKEWDNLLESYIVLPDDDKETYYKLIWGGSEEGKISEPVPPLEISDPLDKFLIKDSLKHGKVFPDHPTYADKLKALKIVEKRLKKKCFVKDMCKLGIYTTRQWFWCRRIKNLLPLYTKKSGRYYVYDKEDVIEWLKDEIEYFRTNLEG